MLVCRARHRWVLLAAVLTEQWGLTCSCSPPVATLRMFLLLSLLSKLKGQLVLQSAEYSCVHAPCCEVRCAGGRSCCFPSIDEHAPRPIQPYALRKLSRNSLLRLERTTTRLTHFMIVGFEIGCEALRLRLQIKHGYHLTTRRVRVASGEFTSQHIWQLEGRCP